MITVNRTETQITGMVNGTPYSRTFTEENYHFMKELETRANTAGSMDELRQIVAEFEPYTRESYKQMVETKCPNLYVDASKNTFHIKVGSKISKVPLPEAFAQKLIKSFEKNIPVEPLLKAVGRFLRHIPGRPAYTPKRLQEFADYISAPYLDGKRAAELIATEGLSPDVAERFATSTQVAITQEGLLVCYKVSKEVMKKFALNEDEEVVQKNRYAPTVDQDTGLLSYAMPEHVEDRLFEPAVMGQTKDAFHCKNNIEDKVGHFIKVGCSHFLDKWSQVGPPMGPGLHCGGLAYIRGYQNEGTVTHNIFVDPADIHTIQINNDGVMTVKRYFVHSSFAGVNKNIYHSSDYAKMNDEEYQQLLSEAVDELNEKVADLKGTIE